jgi:hypothetical protein
LMDKEMMKVEATIIQLDHSFTVPALLAQVQGRSVFPALLTVVNEYGQIKGQSFAFSKSHDEMRDMLENMRHGLEAMNLGPVKLVYTDNVTADKLFLESIFPSLKTGVIRKEKLPDLETLCIPESVSQQVVTNTQMATTILQSILDDFYDERVFYLYDSFVSRVTEVVDSERRHRWRMERLAFRSGKTRNTSTCLGRKGRPFSFLEISKYKQPTQDPLPTIPGGSEDPQNRAKCQR